MLTIYIAVQYDACACYTRCDGDRDSRMTRLKFFEVWL